MAYRSANGIRSRASGPSAFSAFSYWLASKCSRPRLSNRLVRSSMRWGLVLRGLAVAAADEIEEQLGVLGLVALRVLAGDLIEGLLGPLGVAHLQVGLPQRPQQLRLPSRVGIGLER